ncbi:glycosyltransferase family 4 protein [Billgrantia sulfidoxydans]|uniref:Glycosyltransferase family 4 protein n=1 Tax=Billgrantia sulfidoxydans TaxID=2733484 RepID=A0ABX7W6S0_9GAMM|nr:glycosyltransferase family 1 protein [Halomonas sulfidoxydans]QTP55252.1 glycosyltransferase family 4 protein [Halomonas sulfidoxydans]
MRIVIDLQGAQTESRYRGIGRYSLSLAKAIVRNSGEHDIIIVLSGLLPDTIEPIRASFDGLLPQDNIRVWDAVVPCREIEPGNAWRREAAEYIREAFIESLEPDVIYVSSLIEGYVDDAVTSVKKMDTRVPTVVTLFDLIPFVNPEKYLDRDKSYKGFYSRKIESLRQADGWLAISEATLKEGIKFLSLDRDNIVNISTACDSVFHAAMREGDEKAKLQSMHKIERSFILYSGGADERKNLHRLIRAFAKLPVPIKKKYQLVMAGKMPATEISLLEETAKKSGLSKNDMVFTGYVTDHDLSILYSTCDLFVFPSWHEGFGLPALEAMSCGAAVIGSRATSIPEVIGRSDALFDPYDETSISKKIQEVISNHEFRDELSRWGIRRAKEFSWDYSAKQAIRFFERVVQQLQDTRKIATADVVEALKNRVKEIRSDKPTDSDLIRTAYAISINHPVKKEKQLFVDISELVNRDARTGVQRVTRSLLSELLRTPPAEYSICPVYADTVTCGYRYATQFINHFLNRDGQNDEDDAIEFKVGDVFLGLDLQHHVVEAQENYLLALRQRGVKIFFVVYDLLPITLPESFPVGSKEGHERWLRVLSLYDGAFCISKSVADELSGWMNENITDRQRPFSIKWFHLGADIKSSIPSKGLDDNSEKVIEQLKRSYTFLMVGTVEPRKGQDQVLDAFDVLWSQGHRINLVIVGKQGWMVDALAERLRKHPQRDKYLFWLEGVSDEYLEKLYEASSCLIFASRGEGFGLPLIEAAQYKLPIIARDIPVFREVAGEYAFYFSSVDSHGLAKEITAWLELYKAGNHAKSDKMPWLTWKQSAEQLKEALLGSKTINANSRDESAV